jgi:transposase-like protein
MAKDGSGGAELKELVAKARSKPRETFPAELRDRLVAYARRRWEEGVSNKTLAVELGVNHHTLSYWRARLAGLTARKRVSPLKRVEVVVPEGQRTVTLRGPHGVRVDDLTLDDLAVLLRKLS